MSRVRTIPFPDLPGASAEDDIAARVRALPLPDFPTPDGWEGDPNDQMRRLLGQSPQPPRAIDWDAQNINPEGYTPSGSADTAPRYEGIDPGGYESRQMPAEEAAMAAGVRFGRPNMPAPSPVEDELARRDHMARAQQELERAEQAAKRQTRPRAAGKPPTPTPAPATPPAPQSPLHPKASEGTPGPTAPQPTAPPPPAAPPPGELLNDALTASRPTPLQRENMRRDAIVAMRHGLSEREVASVLASKGGRNTQQRREALADLIEAKDDGVGEDARIDAVDQSRGDRKKRRRSLSEAPRQPQQNPPASDETDGQAGQQPSKSKRPDAAPADSSREILRVLSEISGKLDKLSSIEGLLTNVPAVLDSKLRLG